MKSRSKIVYVLCCVLRKIFPYKSGNFRFCYDVSLCLGAYVLWWCAAGGGVDRAKYISKFLSVCLSVYVTN
jgi:hypothetical protein